MSEPNYGWKHKRTGQISIPARPRHTLEELFKGSSFGLPVREVPDHVVIRIELRDGKWVEQIEDEKDRLWRTVVAASSR
jgi:hypothetical protein